MLTSNQLINSRVLLEFITLLRWYRENSPSGLRAIRSDGDFLCTSGTRFSGFKEKPVADLAVGGGDVKSGFF